MSKIRECFPVDEGELQAPPEADLEPFVVFTKLREDGRWLYAGWLEAPDDETALFYLRSRGVPRAEATALLVLSFVADAIAEIEDADLASDIVARIEDWLALRQG